MWRVVVIALLMSGTGEPNTQDIGMNVTLTTGTTGLGIHLISERRGQGAVIARVVPDSAASHVLRAGDVLTAVAGVEIRLWSLENIHRLLRFRNRVKLQIRRVSQLLVNDSKIEEDIDPSSTSCYACVDGDINDLHAFECTLAPFGGHLPPFYAKSSALDVKVAQPLDHCTRGHRFNTTSKFALLVSRGGCLPGVKARNAAWSGAEIMVMIDGQYPPFPPIPTAAGGPLLVEIDASSTRFRHHLPMVDIPVIVIGNETGYRMISEVRDGRDVATFFHAGLPTTRSTVTPRRQIPLDEARGLQSPRDALGLKSSFRDGHVLFDFGEPGLPGGKMPTIILQVSCGLQTLLTGLETRVVFGKMVPCPVCNGRGAPAEEMRPCKVCSSSGEPGVATVEHKHGVEVKQTLRKTCPLCHGFGENPKRRSLRCQRPEHKIFRFSNSVCSLVRCKGERIIQEHASLDLRIPRGAPDQLKLRYPGIGSQLLGRAAGDVEVVVNVEHHERFERDGSTLHTQLPISLSEALTGFTREVQLLNGTAILLNRTQMTNNNDQIVIRGGGLPAWDPSATEKGDSGASSGARTRVRETNKLGPAIFTCTVAFPEHARSDLKGSEDPRDRSA